MLSLHVSFHIIHHQTRHSWTFRERRDPWIRIFFFSSSVPDAFYEAGKCSRKSWTSPLKKRLAFDFLRVISKFTQTFQYFIFLCFYSSLPLERKTTGIVINSSWKNSFIQSYSLERIRNLGRLIEIEILQSCGKYIRRKLFCLWMFQISIFNIDKLYF